MSFLNKLKNTVTSVATSVQAPAQTAAQPPAQPPTQASAQAPAQSTGQPAAVPTGAGFEPIQGVSLEKYAELAALMKDTGNDQDQCAAIAAAHGIARPDWEAALKGWTARMSEPALQGKVAYAFLPLYQGALAKMRGGAEPSTLEFYAHVSAEYSFRKDANGQQISYEVIFKENNLTQTQWNEITSYWTPKVNDPSDPSARKFAELVQKESDRIFGIKR